MKDIIEQALQNYIDTLPQGQLKEAVSYALLAGGKRIRPLLMLDVIESFGLHPSSYVDIAVSLELIHTYSLIHDDLPAMDDDTLRRGKPTLHIAFNEGLAILAGDTLLTDAFSLITKSEALSPDQKVEMVHTLSLKAGSHGMILGQVLDLASEGQHVSLDELNTMYLLKTSRLLEASLMLGAIVSRSKDVKTFERMGLDLGLLFQIQDDYLEYMSDPSVLGKSKSDELRDKPTYISLIGIEKTKKIILELSDRLRQTLKSLQLEQTLLSETIESILSRKH
jgi:geranylgeranyl diphosphate synthase type II